MSDERHPISNHPEQRKIWMSDARFKVICAGRRGGKTFLIREAIIKKLNEPGKSIGYAAPTRAQAKDIMWRQLKDRIAELSWPVEINESELRITDMHTGSTVKLYTAEKPDAVRGVEFDLFICDEFAEFRSDYIFTTLRPALSDRMGAAIFAFTPKGYNHAHEYFQRGKVKDEESWESFEFKTIDSPFFQTPEGRAEIDEARKNLNEKDFRQEYEASFETHTGRIYYAFDRGGNHTDQQYDPKLPIFIGMDFNRSPMTATFAHMINGKKYIFAEAFLPDSSTELLCRHIKEKFKDNTGGLFCRPDATGSRKTSNSSYSDHKIIRDHGITIQVQPANPKRVDRWACVNKVFEKKTTFVNTKNCPKLVKDLETVSYKTGTCEPDTSNKMLGHISDAGGYDIFKDFNERSQIKQSHY